MRVRHRRRRDAICDRYFIARHKSAPAISFVKELTDAAGLADMPSSFPLVPRYAKKGIRRRVYGAYQIFYRVDGELVHVIRMLHGARDYEALL